MDETECVQRRELRQLALESYFRSFYSSTLDTLPLSVLYRIAHSSQVPLKDGNPASTRFPIGKTGDARSLDANLFAHLKEAAN